MRLGAPPATCLIALVLILLGTGKPDPAPIVQVLEAAIHLAAAITVRR